MNEGLRKFGLSLGLGLNILGCALFYRHKGYFIWFSTIGSISLILGVIYPKALTPLKRLLDRIIAIIGWFASVISLLIAFYLIFTPIGILARLFGKDLLDQKIDKKASSYWAKRKQGIFTKQSYERMG
jgi:Saxitoxin biosynthesis operon protein SxtJ